MTVWSVTIYAIRENRSYSETGVKSSKTIFKGFFNIFLCTSTTALNKINDVRQPGVEPGSTAWKATMLTVTPLTHLYNVSDETFIKNADKMHGITRHESSITSELIDYQFCSIFTYLNDSRSLFKCFTNKNILSNRTSWV